MYDIVSYGRMVADAERTSAYARGLAARIKPGSVILDIGTGPGIMAFLACRAGAAKVYAVEPDDVIQLARAAAEANGFTDRIQFIQALSSEIDLPEKVDGIVSDLRGALPMFGTSIVSLMDARDRFLKSDGWLVSSGDTLWAALVSAPSLHARFIMKWPTAYGFDFSMAEAKAKNLWRTALFNADDLIVEPRYWAALDYKSLRGPNAAGEVAWVVARDVTAHGLAVWFDTETSPGIGFSNSPAKGEGPVYKQAFFPWPKPIELTPGDRIVVRFRAAFVQTDYVWAWQTDISGGDSDQLKEAFRQSTFLGQPISLERWRKRADRFVPELNDRGRVDQRVLELMSRRLPVGEIARVIRSEFPSVFNDWNAALTKVGDLSEQYSKAAEHTVRAEPSQNRRPILE